MGRVRSGTCRWGGRRNRGGQGGAGERGGEEVIETCRVPHCRQNEKLSCHLKIKSESD